MQRCLERGLPPRGRSRAGTFGEHRHAGWLAWGVRIGDLDALHTGGLCKPNARPVGRRPAHEMPARGRVERPPCRQARTDPPDARALRDTVLPTSVLAAAALS